MTESLDPSSRTLTGLHATRLHRTPGAAPGLEPEDLRQIPSSPAPVCITVYDYSPERADHFVVTDIEDFIIQHRPAWTENQGVRWINVDGLTNMDIIRAMAEKYDLHPLAIEDLLHTPQRPKVDSYPGHGDIHARLFIIARMLQLVPDPEGVNGQRLRGEQVSLFLGHKTVLTFQEFNEEGVGDVFDPVRARIRTAGSRVRANDASFLAYSLIDAIVDQYFPILEHYSDQLEELEDAVLERPEPAVIQQIHAVKRELLLVRRASWPMREVVASLAREPHECLSETTRTYLRDVYDHSVQIIDMVETYREFAAGLTETYMIAMSNRMNEIMKVLTIITTIFVPLTFLAGVYGMNFHHMPELDETWTYPAFWAICILLAGAMILWFKRRKWL